MPTVSHADSSRARAHLRRLLDLPGNPNASTISTLSGLSYSTVRDVIAARGQHTAKTCAAVLALDPEQVACAVNAAACIQMIRSLMAMGWDAQWQATRYGRTAEWVTSAAHGRRTITTADALAIRSTVDWVESGPLRRRETTWGPNVADATAARARGWYPLLCYSSKGTLLQSAIRRDYDRLHAEVIGAADSSDSLTLEMAA